jgi:tetratricopeptide (TPR) repeat protein
MSVFLYIKDGTLYFQDNLIPYELVDIIFSKLDIRSLLNVDAVGKTFPRLTERAWQYHREKEKIAFDWHFLKGCPQKWSYHFNHWIKQQFLQDIISSVFTGVVNNDANRKPKAILNDRLDILLVRLAFWREALNGKFYGPRSYVVDAEKAIPREKEALKYLSKEGSKGGDLLLRGLLHEEKTSSEHLYEAIQKNMTWASFLQLVNRGSDIFSMELALAAASKGDYSGLQLLLHIEPQYVSYFDTYENPTRILVALISIAKADLLSKEGGLVQANQLYQEAIDILTSQNLPIPNYILGKAANIKGQLGRIDEAESVYTLCRDMKKDEASSPLFLNAQIPIDLIQKAAEWTVQKQEWKASETRFTQVINSYDPNAHGSKRKLCRILPRLAFVKENLQDYKGASMLYDTTMSYYKAQSIPVPQHIIGQARAAMEQLQNWPEAKHLCDQEIDFFETQRQPVPQHILNNKKIIKIQLVIAKLIQGCPDLAFFVQDPSFFTLYQQSLEYAGLSIPLHSLLNADDLHKFLGDWNKVDLVYLHLFQVWREHAPHVKIPTTIPVQAAYVKEQLENFVEAKSVYDDILAQDKEVTPDTIYKAGCVEKKLENMPDADKHFSRTIDLYGVKETPLHILIDAVFVKEQLEKWSEADRIYTEILETLGEYPDPEYLDKAAFVKVKLGLLEQADALYTKAIKAYESVMFLPSLFEDAARVKEKLGKWEEADALYTRIIAECGEDTSSEVLVKATLVKVKLKQRDEALITLLSNAITKLKIKD